MLPINAKPSEVVVDSLTGLKERFVRSSDRGSFNNSSDIILKSMELLVQGGPGFDYVAVIRNRFWMAEEPI